MPVESRVEVGSDADGVELGMVGGAATGGVVVAAGPPPPPVVVEDRADDVSLTTTSVRNGGSSVAVNLTDFEVDAVKPVGTRLLLVCVFRSSARRAAAAFTHAHTRSVDRCFFFQHAAYLTPPRIRHPLDENVFCAFSISLLYYLFGLIVGVPIFSLLLCALAIAVPVRLIFLLHQRWSSPSHRSVDAGRRSLVRHICDPWWPVQSNQSLTSFLSRPAIWLIAACLLRRTRQRSRRRNATTSGRSERRR